MTSIGCGDHLSPRGKLRLYRIHGCEVVNFGFRRTDQETLLAGSDDIERLARLERKASDDMYRAITRSTKTCELRHREPHRDVSKNKYCCQDKDQLDIAQKLGIHRADLFGRLQCLLNG